MDFTHSSRSLTLATSLRSFIDEVVVPAESAVNQQRERNPRTQPAVIGDLQNAAKDAGLWNLCVRDPNYGPGLSSLDYAPLAEILGPSRLAQEATNCDAPSSINGDALILYGSPAQKDQWVTPQLDGRVRSAFAMTEPDVASSDAANISLAAEEDGEGWVLNGRKWWISGVLHPNCEYMLVLANSDPTASRHRRHSVFVVPSDTPGLTVVRNLPKFGYLDADGHAELAFDNVRLSADALLGNQGDGFAIGQARLGPARVQHCMRTIGVAEQALSLLCERADSRSTFGGLVSSRANIQEWIANARININSARLMTLHTAWKMDVEGDKAAAPDMSAIKVLVMQTATTVVDQAIQVYGAAGVSDDTPLARMYASLRSLRIADGPDEVHLMAIGRRELRRQQADRER